MFPVLVWDEVHIQKNGKLRCSGSFKNNINPSKELGKTYLIDVFGAEFLVVITTVHDFIRWDAVDERTYRNG